MTDKGLLSNILFVAYHTDTYSSCKNSYKQVASLGSANQNLFILNGKSMVIPAFKVLLKKSTSC